MYRSLTHTGQAFNSTLYSQASATANLTAPLAYSIVSFAGGIPVAANANQYIAYRTSLLSFEYQFWVYNTTVSNGVLTYINSWYEYPLTGTAFTASYQNPAV